MSQKLKIAVILAGSHQNMKFPVFQYRRLLRQ